MHKVRLSSLKKNKLNVLKISQTRSAVVFFDNDQLRVTDDLCPHMGGPISRGNLCPAQRVLHCPWHGYKFSTSDLTLQENPNQEIWIKQLAPEQQDLYTTPKYKLRELKYEVRDGCLLIHD